MAFWVRAGGNPRSRVDCMPRRAALPVRRVEEAGTCCCGGQPVEIRSACNRADMLVGTIARKSVNYT